jgi:hypothetical protein
MFGFRHKSWLGASVGAGVVVIRRRGRDRPSLECLMEKQTLRKAKHHDAHQTYVDEA